MTSHGLLKKDKIISYIERFPSLDRQTGLCGVFSWGTWMGKISLNLFCLYWSNSWVGRQGVGAEQTVALRCMMSDSGVVIGVGRSMCFGYWSERVI